MASDHLIMLPDLDSACGPDRPGSTRDNAQRRHAALEVGEEPDWSCSSRNRVVAGCEKDGRCQEHEGSTESHHQRRSGRGLP